MTYKFNNIYINNISSVSGVFEKEGPLGSYFDKTYDDFYMGESTYEDGEVRMIKDSIDILLNKSKLNTSDISLVLAGNLTDELTASNYALKEYDIPYIGVYSACASLPSSIIVGSNMLKDKYIICNTSASNSVCEKQFRNPTEYGTPRMLTTTFTSTGSVSVLISKNKSNIMIESATIGCVKDSNLFNPNEVGMIMAYSAADTLYNHLKDTKRSVNYYDLIVTGDLGLYGMKVLKEYMVKEYNIYLDNYNDCGVMLYDLDKQDVYSGASGPTSMGLVLPYILNMMNDKKLKNVLLIGTGALFSKTTVSQKKSIPSVSHAISLRAI